MSNGLMTTNTDGERLTSAESALLRFLEYGRDEGPARKAFLARKAEIEGRPEARHE